MGIAPASRAPHADAFHRWLGDGCHAGMDWLARDPERRCSPEAVLPGARSVVALAMNYFHPDPDTSNDLPAGGAVRGRIARYARGRDYHNLVAKRLREVDRALAAAGGRQKCFVDSGPILERDFAVRAGIAWHGKSTMAIHPKLGTWFFLAAALTTLEFEAVEPIPMADRCGKCMRCIAACPTGAIIAPHRVDARRCVSYWTIEHRGAMPEWLRPLLGDRIFGCDDCLDACPWNRFARDSREADFAARPASQWLLRDYLRLTPDAFRATFEGSPVRRARRGGFLRNVCVALGNVGSPADLPSLARAARDDDPLVREHAVWAVARISP